MVLPQLEQTVMAGAAIASCFLFVSLYPDVRLVWRDRTTTGRVPLLPMTSMLANCVLWTVYGVVAEDYFPIMATNAIGIGFATFYIAIYHRFATDKRSVQRHLMGMTLGLVIVILYAMFSPESRPKVKQHVGFLAVAACAVMFGSPLVLIKEVVATKNSALLPVGMIFAGVVNSLLWLTYGLIIRDSFVLAPNIVNLSLGAIQFGLLCMYPRRDKLMTLDLGADEIDLERETNTVLTPWTAAPATPRD